MKSRFSYLNTLLVASLGCVAHHSFAETELADEKSLYDLAPDDAAYVRVVNKTSDPVSLTVDGKLIAADAFCSVSELTWVSQSSVISMNDTTMTANAGEIYTVIVDKEMSVIAESLKQDPFKAELATYNLTDSPISILTTKGSRAVFSDIPPYNTLSRTLAPVSVELTAVVGESSASVGVVSLARGAKTDIFVCQSGDSLVFAQSRQ